MPDRDDNKQGSWFGSGRSRLIVQEYGIFLAFLLLVVILTFSNQYFLTPGNISNVLLQTSINGVLAIGMTFVILTRGIDLSVGSVAALGSVLSALLIAEYGPGLSIAATLLGGAACGSAEPVRADRIMPARPDSAPEIA